MFKDLQESKYSGNEHVDVSAVKKIQMETSGLKMHSKWNGKCAGWAWQPLQETMEESKNEKVEKALPRLERHFLAGGRE